MQIPKRNQQRFTIAALLALVFLIVGCEAEPVIEQPVPTTVQITPGSATLESIDATQGFTAVVRDQDGKEMPNAAVSWSGSDPSVFTVSGKRIHGNGDGGRQWYRDADGDLLAFERDRFGGGGAASGPDRDCVGGWAGVARSRSSCRSRWWCAWRIRAALVWGESRSPLPRVRKVVR